MNRPFRWTEIGSCGLKDHGETLSKLLNASGIANEFSKVDVSAVESPQALETLVQGLDFVLVGCDLCAKIETFTERASQKLLNLGYFDSLVRRDNILWPMAFMEKSIVKSVMDLKELDASRAVVIIGAGGMARLAALAASTWGFRRVLFVASQLSQSQETIARLKRWMYDITFEALTFEQLVRLPNVASLTVIAMDHLLTDEQLLEISFFNFTGRDGRIINLSSPHLSSEFHASIADAGCELIDFLSAHYFFDSTWVEHLTGQSLPLDPYLAVFRSPAQ